MEDPGLIGIETMPPCRLGNLTVIMTKFIENCFFRLGLLIGNHPWKTVIGALLLCAVCSSGMAFWLQITDDELLWTPYGSPFLKDKKWIEENFPKDMRYESVIIEGDNVLTPDHIQYLAKLNENVINATTQDNLHAYTDLCIRDLDSGSKEDCYQESILRLWNSDINEINNLSQDEILKSITEALLDERSRVKTLLSGVTYDSSGQAKSAKGLMNVWILRENGTKEENQASVDAAAFDWETVFINLVVGDGVPPGLPNGTKMYGLAERSYNDEIDGAVNSNLLLFLVGFGFIFIYIAVVLGRWNCMEQRVLLSLMGILVIGLSIFASFGLCFYMRIFYADMHPIIPFLLLGIGVDDMFVIVQSLENLTPKQKSLPVPQRIGLTMKHAGVSITVTSLTDMAAFLIGSSSSMPILRTFCLFAAIGVLFLYIFASTFFVACLALDEGRIDARKPCGCCSRPKPSDWKPNSVSQIELGKLVFEKGISKYLFKLPVQISVIVIVLVAFGSGIYGITQMKLDYNSIWYMRKSSYQVGFYDATARLFPDNGERVQVYIGQIDYWNHLESLLKVKETLNENAYIREGSIQYWFDTFYNDFCIPNEEVIDDFAGFEGFHKEDVQLNCSSELGFKQNFLMFLDQNRNFYQDLKFNVSLEDEDPLNLWNSGAFEITASRANFQHSELQNTTIQNIAMDQVKNEMSAVQFDGEDFSTPIVYGFMYIQWEANKNIVSELIRNLVLTFATIVVVTLFLVANIRVSLFVLICVVFTVANVCGFAHFMGLTIEIVTSLILILSCGLALDYAAHIGVAYLCAKGHTRKEKAKEAVVSMGTAVFHGGFSTFTAFVLLAFSDSYIFTTFFKMFAMVVTFGLFHGIVFLSVLLSLFGPVFDTDEGSEPVFNPVSPDSPSNLKLKTSPVLPNGNSDSLPTESHVVEKF